MSNSILCGPCGYAENNKKAEKWCTVCEEGLCVDCEKVHKSIKTTRNHRLISTQDYRQIENNSVSLNCEDHDKRFELYCKTHDAAVCLGCVPSRHRTCSDVIPLEKAAANAKQSTALADLEDTLTLTIQNLEQIINDRDSAMEKLEGQKQFIKNTINATRARIMDKLADLEQKLLLESDSKHGDCKSEESKLLTRLKKSE
ncbi:tripartite motif-containing protein 29-like [Mytilus edulis]|uniref:tripartite motif-containing protein 29-like n=1 Tax=Mytilus edulis TaxID=6550 RepID=UPI0039F1477E